MCTVGESFCYLVVCMSCRSVLLRQGMEKVNWIRYELPQFRLDLSG